MTTYSLRCRHNACRHRRVGRTHPDEYKVVPACPACGQRKGWRIENRQYNKRGLCRCDGPMGRNGEPFPHRTTHPCCDQHPHGVYNQARARGVAHDDIAKEYWPMNVTINAGLQTETDRVLSSYLHEELDLLDASAKNEFLARFIELLTEKGLLTPAEVGNLVYTNIEAT